MKKWSITYTLFGGFIAFCAIYFGIKGFNEETIQTLIRLSARTSFMLFATAFSASALNKISKNNFTKWLLANRKYIGVSFALIHFFHLGLLITKNHFFEPVFEQRSMVSLIGGIIVYTFIGLMFLTSFKPISSKLSHKQWSFLHTFGSYFILTIFTIAYSKRVFNGELIFLPLFIIAVTVWILRLIRKFK